MLAVVVAALAAGADEVAAQGCAMCKTAIGGAEDPLAKGINASIIFMMGVPFVLFGAVGGWLTYMFWGYRAEGLGATTPAAAELSEKGR